MNRMGSYALSVGTLAGPCGKETDVNEQKDSRSESIILRTKWWYKSKRSLCKMQKGKRAIAKFGKELITQAKAAHYMSKLGCIP